MQYAIFYTMDNGTKHLYLTKTWNETITFYKKIIKLAKLTVVKTRQGKIILQMKH